MRTLVTTVCLLAIACNAALAAVGGIAFCIEKETDGRIRLTCIQDKVDPCCDDDPQNAGSAKPLGDCETCLDASIDAGPQEDATRSAERSAHKAPLASEWLEPEFISVASKPLPFLRAHPAHGPPLAGGACQQFTNTVAFRI